jgi:hypothetical protein
MKPEATTRQWASGNPGWPVTQRDLGADVNPDYVPMDLVTQDQKRADVWIAELERYVRDGNMPQRAKYPLKYEFFLQLLGGRCADHQETIFQI